MTLRSEIYFCTLKSSSRLGRGVADSGNALRMSWSRLKDSKRSQGNQRAKQRLAVRDGLRLKREKNSGWFFRSCSSVSMVVL